MQVSSEKALLPNPLVNTFSDWYILMLSLLSSILQFVIRTGASYTATEWVSCRRYYPSLLCYNLPAPPNPSQVTLHLQPQRPVQSLPGHPHGWGWNDRGRKSNRIGWSWLSLLWNTFLEYPWGTDSQCHCGITGEILWVPQNNHVQEKVLTNEKFLK